MFGGFAASRAQNKLAEAYRRMALRAMAAQEDVAEQGLG